MLLHRLTLALAVVLTLSVALSFGWLALATWPAPPATARQVASPEPVPPPDPGAPVSPGTAAKGDQNNGTSQASLDITDQLAVEAGQVLQSSLHSDALDMDLPYRVYLPPGYELTQDRYPVLYLLHGGGGDFQEWTRLNHVALFADAMIVEGRIRPMIVVTPEGDQSYFVNQSGGGARWADYIVQDLVGHVDATYRTLALTEYRAIGGISMGGHGSLQLAFNHPDVFSVIAANSPSLRTEPRDGDPESLRDWDYYAAFDPIRLATSAAGLGDLKIWIDIGEEDEWLPAAELLHRVLLERGLEHQFVVHAGGFHWTSYWIEHTPEYLSFVSSNVGPNSPPNPPPGILRRSLMSAVPVEPPGEEALEESELRAEVTRTVRAIRFYAALAGSDYAARHLEETLSRLDLRLEADGGPLAPAIAELRTELRDSLTLSDVVTMRWVADEMERRNLWRSGL